MAASRGLAILVVAATIMILWYGFAVRLNAPQLIDRYERGNVAWTWGQLVRDAYAMDRPVLPAPHQVVVELKKTVLDTSPTSRRSLLYHAWVTLASTLLGFALRDRAGLPARHRHRPCAHARPLAHALDHHLADHPDPGGGTHGDRRPGLASASRG